ncbi:reverse transcriptase domain-containing protein [Tanacetum coccineum]
MNFIVVRSPSQHNGIIGRPGIRKIRAIPSTTHRILKFLVEAGTVTLQSSMIIPMECAMISGPSTRPPEVGKILEEKIKVAIHPEYPEQTIAIGSTLIEKGRNKLSEHRLNVREGCLPIRQKKRGQTPERNKAIQEEVEKLVDAGIMKEFHYHSWLSNPVMVKKHNGSWRMCVDFKDLNKACPQDGYPLPEIDWKVESICGYPFKLCLKNVGATYQRLVDKAFQRQIGRNLEVYVDDLVIKSRTEEEIIRDIAETFKTLRFEDTNNEAEYEALIVGLQIAEQMGVKNISQSKVGLTACSYPGLKIHHPVPRNLQQNLTPITSPWPFYKWGIDIVGPFPEGPSKVKFLIVAIDYFTKWIEAKPVATITGNQVKKFVWDNIIPPVLRLRETPTNKWFGGKSKQEFGGRNQAQLDKRSKDWIGGTLTCLMGHRTRSVEQRETPFSLNYGYERMVDGKPVSCSGHGVVHGFREVKQQAVQAENTPGLIHPHILLDFNRIHQGESLQSQGLYPRQYN